MLIQKANKFDSADHFSQLEKQRLAQQQNTGESLPSIDEEKKE